MNHITPHINQQNIETVKKIIEHKKSSIPFHATSAYVSNIVTDYDHFPYTRNFRGIYNSHFPIVNEREAGWRARHDTCYEIESIQQYEQKPQHCFSIPCSTVLPCNPEYLNKYGSRDIIDVTQRKECINMNR